jgi:cyclopropane fatty-acyl-phospholipid synthase-like methyltransferase
VSEFDFEGVFDEDYLYFYEPMLTPEASDEQAGLIAHLLELGAGREVLDVPCGHGRIGVRLAALGCRVTGLDASAPFLDVARREAKARGVEVELVLGDMRALPWAERFDAVVNWFTSFGYFDDTENRAMLGEFHRTLRPGGRLLVESLHRDRIVRTTPQGGVQVAYVHERDADLMLDRNVFDAVDGRVASERIVIRDGRVRRTRFSVRVFTPSELRVWLEDAGFVDVSVFDERGEQFGLESRRMIAVATRR